MKELHIFFSAKGDQWETSFLISGDGGGAEDDAEHIWSNEWCRPMRKHHISFNNFADQGEMCFLISGDGGGAEDDAEHLIEHWTISTNENPPHQFEQPLQPMREELSHFRRALNNIDQWKSTTSVLAPKATNERRAFSFQVTEEVRRWCWAHSRALNNIDQWKSTTSV